MLSYIFKKIFYVVPIILGVVLCIFLLFNVVAGDPTAVILGKYATAKQMAELRHQLGLDKSLMLQYLDMVKSVFSFDFGISWKTKQPILSMLLEGASNSLTITLPVFFLSNILATSISLWISSLRNKIFDKVVVFVCIVLTSVSILAYVLFGQWFLSFKMGIFEICGYEKGFPHFIPYVALPVLICVFLSLGHEIRYYRSIILDEISQDYVRTAIAKGLPKNIVLFKHVLKNIMIPIVYNAVSQFPVLIMGNLVIENFFSIPGFSNIIVQAIYNSDFPVIKAGTIIISVACIFFNILGDVVSKFLDPRINLK